MWKGKTGGSDSHLNANYNRQKRGGTKNVENAPMALLSLKNVN